MREHRYVNMNVVRNNPNKYWNKYDLSYNKQLTVKDIEDTKLDTFGIWNWDIISININIQEVRNNPHKPWNIDYLSQNKTITVKDIKELPLLSLSTKTWNWNVISENINIQEVRNNPNETWNKDWLSKNKELTVKDIDTLILPNSIGIWDWYYMTVYIDIEQIINNPNKPWSKRTLKSNKGVTNKILEFFDAGLLKHLQKNIPKFRYHTDIVVKCDY